MTDDVGEIDISIQRPKSGRALFGLILESLLRAGVKSLPVVGSGLDQAYWGTKDAVAKAELRSLVDTILSNVNEIRDSVQNPSPEDIASITEVLLSRSEVQSAIDRLDRANASTLKILVEFVRQLGYQSHDLESAVSDLQELSASIESATSAAIEELRKTHKNAELESSIIHEELKRIYRLLRPQSGLSQPELETIVSDLCGLETKMLSLFGFAVGSALELPRDRQLCLTVDFSEIHRYAALPYSDDPIGAFSVYDFRAISAPFYLLPGSAFELNAFLKRRLLDFADPKELRKKLRARIKQLLIGQHTTYRASFDLEFLADLTLNDNSPLQRISRLFKHQRVILWNQTLPSERELRQGVELLFQSLTEIRPNAPHANFIDAQNLAIVRSLNAALQPGHSPVVHISGSPSLIRVARKIDELGTTQLPIPTVLHPCSLAFARFLDTNAHLRNEGLAIAAQQVRVLRSSVGRWVSIVRSLNIEELGRMAIEVRSVVGALETLSLAASPFHRSLLDWEAKDLIGDENALGSTLWEERFEQVHLSVLETIIDLLSYLEPLEHAMAPFRDLQIKLSHRS